MNGLVRALMAAAVSLPLWGCSQVTSVWQQRDYNSGGQDSIKRIVVAGWAPHAASGLDAVLAHVAEDLVKLRKNYLVQGSATLKQSWAEACGGKAEGVLLVRALDVHDEADSIGLQVACELYRCEGGELTWRATAAGREASHNADLAQLTDNYAGSLGPPAKHYAAPAFVLLQELVAALPDVVLSDDDIAEKIELGRALPHALPMAAALARRPL